MVWKRGLWLGLALVLGGTAVKAQEAEPVAPPATPPATIISSAPSVPSAAIVDGAVHPAPANEGDGHEAPPKEEPKGDEDGYGPTPFLKVNILQDLLCPDKDTKYKIGAWIEADYNWRSTGPGTNAIAPVMNTKGNEFEARQFGLYLSRNLDPKECSWGFNIIALGGNDGNFLGPTAGWYRQGGPGGSQRIGFNFTDANVTLHIPCCMTEGGIDIKAGRQTTVLGPMGALAWQRPFGSSDYAWYNMEEGRYTGVSAVVHLTKQLDVYAGCEVGGWGVWFDIPNNAMCGIGQINYWLDEDCKKVKVWTTCLCGPTGHESNGNTTVCEFGMLINYSDQLYQIIDNQNVYSRAPVFGVASPGYLERAYDAYTYVGFRVTKQIDVVGRFEWYKDVDGQGYAGGFGRPHTTYLAETLGFNYHPTKWLEFRPEVRYDSADHPNFGENYNQKHQVDCLANVLLKF